MANVYAIGVADNQGFYNVWVEEDVTFSQLQFRNLEVGVFSGDWTDRKIPVAVWLCCWGRYKLHHPGARTDLSRVIALTIAELLAPQLPTNLSLAREFARREFLASVNALLADESLATVTDGSHNGFCNWVNGLPGDAIKRMMGYLMVDVDGNLVHPDGPTQPQLQDILAAPPQYCSIAHAEGTWRIINPFVPGTQVRNLQQAYYILMYLSTIPTRISIITGLDLLTNVYCAFMKRGTMSEGFLDKVRTGINDDLGKNVLLNSDACALLYRRYSRYINDQNIRAVICHWESLMPETALRLRLVVAQSANSGLTALICIGSAMKLFPDFDWHRIQNIFPQDWTKFHLAAQEVGDNKYYGFKHNLGPVKSTNYKSLTYPCKELLIRVNGQGSLSRYGGWPRTVAHQGLIDQLIVNYQNKLARRITGNLQEGDNDDIDFIPAVRDVINYVSSAERADLYTM